MINYSFGALIVTAIYLFWVWSYLEKHSENWWSTWRCQRSLKRI